MSEGCIEKFVVGERVTTTSTSDMQTTKVTQTISIHFRNGNTMKVIVPNADGCSVAEGLRDLADMIDDDPLFCE